MYNSSKIIEFLGKLKLKFLNVVMSEIDPDNILYSTGNPFSFVIKWSLAPKKISFYLKCGVMMV